MVVDREVKFVQEWTKIRVILYVFSSKKHYKASAILVIITKLGKIFIVTNSAPQNSTILLSKDQVNLLNDVVRHLNGKPMQDVRVLISCLHSLYENVNTKFEAPPIDQTIIRGIGLS